MVIYLKLFLTAIFWGGTFVAARVVAQHVAPYSAFIINTSREGVINEQDLIEALRGGVIAGAGLDVFENEPLQPVNGLLSLKNLILTPIRRR